MHLKIFPLPNCSWTYPASKETVSPGWCQLWTQDPSPALSGRLFPGKVCREDSPKLKLIYWLCALIKTEKFLKIISNKTNYKEQLSSSPVIERCNVKQIVIKGDRHNESHRSSSLEMIGISVVRGKHHKYWTKYDYKKAAPRHQDNNLSSADLRVKEPRFCLRACMESFHEWIQIFEIISSVLCFCDKSTVFFWLCDMTYPKILFMVFMIFLSNTADMRISKSGIFWVQLCCRDGLDWWAYYWDKWFLLTNIFNMDDRSIWIAQNYSWG